MNKYNQISEYIPGPIALFGSGETSPSGQRIFDRLMGKIPTPPDVVLLETPAGFELNSPLVAQKIADFLDIHLKNYKPRTQVIPARKRGTEFSPDDPTIAEPILRADLIFMGPGSPTYAVKQLRDSKTWNYMLARHRLGAGIALASAASIAIGRKALPVYEIYKVGDELHWVNGLDLFGVYGLDLVIVPHWNNNDGGDQLDTSRCFMGQERFDPLVEMLPDSSTIVGIDEQSGLIIDFEQAVFEVVGKGAVTVIRDGHETRFDAGEDYPLDVLGGFQLPDINIDIPEAAWRSAVEAEIQKSKESQPGDEVLQRVRERESARADQDWETADRLRNEIINMGWEIRDTDNGPELERMKSENE